jgi:hypothetical protein
MSDSERLLYEWEDAPFVSVRKRHIRVQHRLLANWYPGVGVDLRHVIKCEDRGHPEWTLAESWEIRDHGVDHHRTKAGTGVL